MRKSITMLCAAAALCGPLPALSEPEVMWHTMEAMGCMKLRECTDEVYELTDVSLLREHFPTENYTMVRDEANELISLLNKSGVKVYLGAGRYFPRTHRGSYYTDTNTFFLNANHMWDQYTFLEVLRHEAWHAAQDCMAGTLDNTMIAVIHDNEDVPKEYQLSASVRYQGDWARAIPWEQEAIWAGQTPMMSVNAMAACASDTPMWHTYEPTPKTAEWLTENGYQVLPSESFEL